MFVKPETATTNELKVNFHKIYEHLKKELEPEKAALRESLIDLQESLMEGENVSRKISEVSKSIKALDLTSAACNRRLKKLKELIPARLKNEAQTALSQRAAVFQVIQDEKKELHRRLLEHLAAAAVVAEQLEGKRMGLFGAHWREVSPNLNFERFHFGHMEIADATGEVREKSPAYNQPCIIRQEADFHKESSRLQKIMDGSPAEVFNDYIGYIGGLLTGEQPEAEDAVPKQEATAEEDQVAEIVNDLAEERAELAGDQTEETAGHPLEETTPFSEGHSKRSVGL